MGSLPSTHSMTTAHAVVHWLSKQFIVIDGQEQLIFGGGFGIFGHGNVTGLGEALYLNKEALPLYRGQTEQSMGFAAAGYAKYHLRQRMMFCIASGGPGTSSLMTSAALAHANRLPMLMLCGDTFLTRSSDPVLQQIENFSDPTFRVNDAFKPVTRYWDRICHPAQVIQSLPQALATLLDPADCGPAFIGLPQDVQGRVYDYPEAFFEKTVHRIQRIEPDTDELADATELLKSAERPIIIAGGGVQYSRAVQELTEFAETHQIPIVETIAGRANLLSTHPLCIGPIGVTGSNPANAIAEQADVIVSVGTRLQDFTIGSGTAFAQDAQYISLNVGRYDANKHRSLPIVGDAKLGLLALQKTMSGYKAPNAWTQLAQSEQEKWDAYVSDLYK